ncbi:hypothetical protein L210DRAFT_894835 [Boletus edulis BED1]|uniref:Uncharacterized protein n=1 Tax=Boletus edulis BED1 TaxID=1328754 RepID=A0AAD4GJY8_BOLED|nr:hypothetical protein L210DRAFT_894835 [Boletus edulis BED1]
MLLPQLILSCLAQLVQETTSNTIYSTSCPPPDGTTRSVWSILGSCALTLLICVWHTIHYDLPRSRKAWYKKRVGFVLLSFFAPEVVVALASMEWLEACQTVNRFRDEGYEWSKTHSFFAKMGGFVYRGQTIDSLRFLVLVKKNEVINPFISVQDIKDKSKSDSIGKAILTLQLLWFTLQVVVRGSRGLAITLVELDTVCMALLSLLVLFFWWDKPLRPERPLLFYSPQDVNICPPSPSALSKAWKKPGRLDRLTDIFACTGSEETTSMGIFDEQVRQESTRLIDKIDKHSAGIASLCATWMILGALHLIAWNFEFPTEEEKVAWRIASLVLAGGPLALFGMLVIGNRSRLDASRVERVGFEITFLASVLSVVSRVFLVALMIASLRALPCSAHQTVAWTSYIPHL